VQKTIIVEAILHGLSSVLDLNKIYDRTFLREYIHEKEVLVQTADHETYMQENVVSNVYSNLMVEDLYYRGETRICSIYP